MTRSYKRTFLALLPISLLLLTVSSRLVGQTPPDSVYFTTGLKVGEVSDTSAVLLVRLAKHPRPRPLRHDRKAAPYRTPLDFDNGMPVAEMDGHLAGVFGQVKIVLVSADRVDSLDWTYVSPLHDFQVRHTFIQLRPRTGYRVELYGRTGPDGPVTNFTGSFRTAPPPDEAVAVSFVATSCQYFWDYDDPVRGFMAYDAMARLKPDFLCQTGDYVYYDKEGPLSYDVATARHKWSAMNAWPALVDCYANTPIYLQKDDHDLLSNDASPYSKPYGEITYADGLELWREQAPLTGKPYRSVRWGKDLELWFLEIREFRSANYVADGPEKTLLGEAQKRWLEQSLAASDATFKLIVSPTPIVGPDRKNKRDNHSNEGFAHEGEWLRALLGGLNKVFVVNGDRHWQYVSRDLGGGLVEVSMGAISDSHADGWPEDERRPEHEFLRVGGGFLSVDVLREAGRPTIIFRHHDVEGKVVNEARY